MFLKWMIVYFLIVLTGNPILIILLLILVYGALDWRYFGFFPQFNRWFRRNLEIRELTRALQINPHDAPSQLALGRAYLLNGNPQKAISPLQAAFPKMKEFPEIHYYLGLAFLSTGREVEGKELLLDTIKMDPRFQYGEPYLKLGEYYLKGKDYRAGLEMLETFCSIHTSSSEGFYQLGMVQLALGDKEHAAISFNKAIEAYKISPGYKKQIDRKWRWKAGKSLATL